MSELVSVGKLGSICALNTLPAPDAVRIPSVQIGKLRPRNDAVGAGAQVDHQVSRVIRKVVGSVPAPVPDRFEHLAVEGNSLAHAVDELLPRARVHAYVLAPAV